MSRLRSVFSSGRAPLRAALRSSDVREVVRGLEEVRKLAFTAPKEAVAFEPEVRALCSDERLEPPPVQVRLCSRARDVHARLFAALEGKGAWKSLTEVVDAMLRAGLGMSLGPHFRALEANGISAARVGAFLVERVADRRRAAVERVHAREALAVLARANEPHPSPEGLAAAKEADDLLVAALRDPSEPGELKRAICEALPRWMPDRLPSLQGEVIARTPVPSIHELPGSVRYAEIDRQELFDLLRDPRADLDRALGAIGISEYFARLVSGTAGTLEPLLLARTADGRRLVDRGRELCVAVQAQRAHRQVWQLLRADERSGGRALSEAIVAATANQGAVREGDESVARNLAMTVLEALSTADRDGLAAALEAAIANRRASTWPRLHAYFALQALPAQAAKADEDLFAALADPQEDAQLRSEAHALLAPRLPSQVHDLQARGLLPHPPLPPVEALYYFSRYDERSPEGEWLLSAEARRTADTLWPEDLIASLRDFSSDPARACAAAALAPLVARRVPGVAGPLAEALRGCLGKGVRHATVADRLAVTFELDRLCDQALREMGSTR